jgi:hypothetical protein
VLGDADNITAVLVKDGGSPAATDDVNPAEIGLGLYRFSLTQAESDADEIILVATSATPDVRIEPLQVFTEPEARILDAAYDKAKAAATQDDISGVMDVLEKDGVKLSIGTGAGQLNVSGGKVPATLVSTDVTGNLPAHVKGQDNIDFGALQKAALNAASVTVSDKTGFSLSDDNNAAKSAASQMSVDALPATLSAAHGSGSWESVDSGDGGNAVLVTVQDDEDEPIAGAVVRLSRGGISYRADADEAGIAEFGVNEEGTYSIVVSRPGFAGHVDTLEVAGAETEELVVMAQQAIPAPTLPGQIVCYGVTLTAGGELEGGVDIVIELLAPGPAGVYSRAMVEVTSSEADGQFSVELARESTYQIRRALGRRGWVQFTTTDADSMELPAV